MEKHDLHHEFPQFHEKIQDLKVKNTHFHHIAEEYNKINKEIHQIESGVHNTNDQYLTDLRKIRMHLKDEIYKMLVQK